MASWFNETNVPRYLAGASSAIYMGDRMEATPTAIPPNILEKRKKESEWDEALPIAERKNRKAANISTFLRPYWSPAFPAIKTPAMQPNNKLLTVQPNAASDNPK